MAAVLSFSPVGAEMAEEHVYLSLFPQCLWGKGAHLDHAPCPSPDCLPPHPTDPHLDHPSPTYPPV